MHRLYFLLPLPGKVYKLTKTAYNSCIMVSEVGNSSPKQKYMVYLDEDVDKAFQEYLHDNYGQSVRVISATFTKALIMLLKKEGYLDGSKDE